MATRPKKFLIQTFETRPTRGWLEIEEFVGAGWYNFKAYKTLADASRDLSDLRRNGFAARVVKIPLYAARSMHPERRS